MSNGLAVLDAGNLDLREDEERKLTFAFREPTLPDISLLHGRMLVSAWEFGLESGKFFESSTFFLLIKTQQAISGTSAATYKVMEPQFILPSAGDGPKTVDHILFAQGGMVSWLER